MQQSPKMLIFEDGDAKLRFHYRPNALFGFSEEGFAGNVTTENTNIDFFIPIENVRALFVEIKPKSLEFLAEGALFIQYSNDDKKRPLVSIETKAYISIEGNQFFIDLKDFENDELCLQLVDRELDLTSAEYTTLIKYIKDKL